jgi:periodic tryptophan protein 1
MCSWVSEDEEEMDVDAGKGDEVLRAHAAANALNKDQDGQSSVVQDISNGLRELDMDHYDDEDEGSNLFLPGKWETQ